jgi:hypothetical protein
MRDGYGAPQIASLQAEAPGLGPVPRMADAVRPAIEAVASDLRLECIVLARRRPRGRDDRSRRVRIDRPG